MVIFRRDASGKASLAPPPPPPPSVKLKDAADALLYLGPRDHLTHVSMSSTELEGTPYGKEIQRRLKIEGFPSDLNLRDEKTEAPQFPKPEPEGGVGPVPFPAPPRNMDAPLPPRPPSQ